MSSHQNSSPNGEYFHMVNPETGVIMLVPILPGFQPYRAEPHPNATAAAAVSTAPPGNIATTAAAVLTAPVGNIATTAPPGNNATNAGSTGAEIPSVAPGNNASAAAGSTAPPGNNSTTAAAGSNPPGKKKREDSLCSSDMSCYAPENARVSQLHLDAKLHPESLVEMECYSASSSKSAVVRMVFCKNEIRIKMDTRENVTIPNTLDALATFMKSGAASSHLVLVFVWAKRDCIKVDPLIWTAFTKNTTFLSVAGSVYMYEIRRLVQTLENVHTLNVCNQKFVQGGWLMDFCRFIPRNITSLVYDARHTSNSSLIENVMALYGDNYMRQCNNNPCFKKIILVVDDFCTKDAFAEQIRRLAQMLIDDECYATIITMFPGDDAILETLLALGFKRGQPGYFGNINKQYDKITYWYTKILGKTIFIGFRDPVGAPIPEADAIIM